MPIKKYSHIVPNNIPAKSRLSSYIIGVFPMLDTPSSTKKAIKAGRIYIKNRVGQTGNWVQSGDLIEYHLQNIKSNTAYALAEAMSRKYVSSRRLRMMFLRADRYNSEDAAERMIRFFDLKESLFGVHKLVKDITLDDLDENDIE